MAIWIGVTYRLNIMLIFFGQNLNRLNQVRWPLSFGIGYNVRNLDIFEAKRQNKNFYQLQFDNHLSNSIESVNL